MITKLHNAISKTLGQLKKTIKKENKLIWDIQKNTEDVEKWVQKREEPEKETKENKRYFAKWNLMASLTK